MAQGTPRDRHVHARDSTSEVADNSIGDPPLLAALFSQIPADECIVSVSGDDAYHTKDCHKAIALRAAHFIIPTRKNAKPRITNRCGVETRNAILNTTCSLGRVFWRKWSGYHRPSLVETKMRCIKLLGESVIARDFGRRVAELKSTLAYCMGESRRADPWWH